MLDQLVWLISHVQRAISSAVKDLDLLIMSTTLFQRTYIANFCSCLPDQWVKLNTDDNYLPSSGACSTSGVIRDTHGFWLFEFASLLGDGGALLAKIMTIKQGLSLCWQRWFRKVQCESDCSKVVCLLHHGGLCAFFICSAEIAAILQLLHLDWEVSLIHTYKVTMQLRIN